MERKETPQNFCEEVYGKSTNVDIGKWKSINTYIIIMVQEMCTCIVNFSNGLGHFENVSNLVPFSRVGIIYLYTNPLSPYIH